MSPVPWLVNLVADSETPPLLTSLAQAPADVLFVADDACHAVLTDALNAAGLPLSRLARLRHAHLHLADNLELAFLVVVSAEDEERERLALIERLEAEKFPPAILTTLNVQTFIADFIAAHIARRPAGDMVPRSAPLAPPPALYAIVNTPRAGSTYLSGLLEGEELGRPTEHVRPWVAHLIRDRPPGLFDLIRLIRNVVRLDSGTAYFGTKLISHFIEDIAPALTPSETSYVLGLIETAKAIYLYRTDKLDQAISTRRAVKTGVWHSTADTPRQALAPGALDTAFEALNDMVQGAMTVERRLATRLIGAPSVLSISYDALSDDPAGVCAAIAAFLDVNLHANPSSAFVKLADAASEDLRTKFLADARTSLSQVRLTGPEALAEARAEAARLAADERATAAAIRQGHANSRSGDYQDRHYYLIDYDHHALAGLEFMIRGPLPRSLERGDYVAFLGASQTMGAFAADPFPSQAARATGVEALNLGRGGASPEFFLREGPLRELIVNARAVVVQVMSARMVSTSAFTSVEGRARMRLHQPDGAEALVECDEAWDRAFAERTPAQIEQLVKEAQARWIEATRAIAAIARGPTCLVWMSEVQPPEHLNLTNKGALFGAFPQMIDRSMLDAAAARYNDYVEVVSARGMPAPCRSDFSGEVLPVVFGGGDRETQTLGRLNHYYPSQAMHDDVAAQLGPVLASLLQRKAVREA